MDAMIKLQEQFRPGQLSNYDTVNTIKQGDYHDVVTICMF
jgi:hypothetical protein